MQGRDKHSSSQFATISSILTKIYRYFGLARDISSFKRTFYSILDADRRGRAFQLGNKPSGAKFATIYSILSKITRYFGTFEIFRRLNAHFTPFYTQIAMEAVSSLETGLAARNS